MALTDRAVWTLKVPGMYSDGHGLYLRVDDAEHKRWVQRIKVKNGAQRNLGLGAYPLFSLAEAREQAIGNQKMARLGLDPLREKQALTRVQTIPTFAAACSSYISLNRPSWKSDRHADQWAASLAKYAYPLLGDKLVSEITRSHVQALLEPIWTAMPETARRVRQRIANVMRWCKAREYCDGDNPADRAGLSLPDQRYTRGHYRALPYEAVGAAP